jgi:hypothetical protein
MRKVVLCVVTVFFLLSAQAQNGLLKGRVLDEKGNGVPFVNVGLLRQQNGVPLAGGSLTDSSGAFSMASPVPGSYRLQFTSIGFTKTETDSFIVAGIDFTKDFAGIVLKRDAKDLQNIDITATRPSIIQLPDRLVVNVQGTAMAAGNTAFNVLAKAPGVFVDPEGNIQLNGRGGATVMIDGRLTYLSARDLRNLLEGTSAENIKSIEIITNPSSKYDAEGTSGIINIVFKKNVLQGINGSLNAGYTTNLKQHFYSAGASINHKSGRWNSFLNTDFSRRGSGREATFTRIFYAQNKTTYFDQEAIGNFYSIGPPSVRLGTDFTLSENHSVGFIASYNTNKLEAEFLSDTYIGNGPKAPTQYVDADNYNNNVYKGLITNLHYSGKMDTNGTTLSADVDFGRIRNEGEGFFYNNFRQLATGQTNRDALYTYTPSGFDIYSGKIDFSYAVNKTHKLETGGRLSRVESDNDSRFYFNNAGRVLDPLRTNHFHYTENIYAAYLNWSGTLSPKISVQTGLRMEQTISKGESFTTGQVNNRKYLNFFPSVFIQQKVSDNYGINYSYSRRLTRPNYGSLNPFRSYRDPYTWTEGNPFLRPQYTNSFNVSQTIKKLYIVQLFYQLTTDVMIELPMLDVDNAITTYTTGNVDNSYSGGISAIVPIKISKKWDTRNTAQLSYSKFTTQSNNGPVVNEQLFTIWKKNSKRVPKEKF